MANWSAFFDESGTHEGTNVLTLGGYLFSEEGVKRIMPRWQAALKRHDLPYFHMVDCAHGNDLFKQFDLATRAKLAKELIILINEYSAYGVCAVINPYRFDNAGDAYTYLSQFIINDIIYNVRAIDPDPILIFSFECGHRSESSLKREWDAVVSSRTIPWLHKSHLQLIPKGSNCLLETADILCWQTAKCITDRISARRPARKDYTQLLSSPFHQIAYLSTNLQVIYGNQATVLNIVRDRNPTVDDEERDDWLHLQFSNGEAANRRFNRFCSLSDAFNPQYFLDITDP